MDLMVNCLRGNFEVCETYDANFSFSMPGTLPAWEGAEFHFFELPEFSGPLFHVASSISQWLIAPEWEKRLAEVCVTVCGMVKRACKRVVERVKDYYSSKVKHIACVNRPCVLRL
jgi:hypothetical protein